jgi:hypothetical protein
VVTMRSNAQIPHGPSPTMAIFTMRLPGAGIWGINSRRPN